MRGIIGLVGLLGVLIAVYIIVHLYAINAQTALKARQQVEPTLEHITGQGPDGGNAMESAKLESQDRNGKFATLTVSSVVGGGAYDKHFGLLAGDVIVAINGARLGDFELADPDMAKAQVFEAYRYSRPITVERNGTRMDLPASGATAAPPSPLNVLPK